MTKLIVGNWKMNMDLKSASTLSADLVTLNHQLPVISKVVVCPPFPYLGITALTLLDSSISLGAQDCSNQSQGAFTGQVSASMLADLSCEYVIVGHSERRTLLRETNEIIYEKAQKAFEANLTPIICIGESLEERDQGQAIHQVLDQAKHSSPEGNYILAYEPIWAIGSGKIPTFDQIAEIHQALHNEHPEHLILYGGSVTPKNASEILNIPHVSGALIGGMSLKANEFWQISQI